MTQFTSRGESESQAATPENPDYCVSYHSYKDIIGRFECSRPSILPEKFSVHPLDNKVKMGSSFILMTLNHKPGAIKRVECLKESDLPETRKLE